MNFGRKIACGVLLLCLSESVAAQVRFSNQKINNGGESALRENVGKLINASAMIYQLYVDSVDSKKMVEDAINGILSKLDPHSAYTNAVETKRFTEPLEGSFDEPVTITTKKFSRSGYMYSSWYAIAPVKGGGSRVYCRDKAT